MNYTISKEFHFDAAHQLHGLPDGHKCGRLHGHTYRVQIILQSPELDSVGFVRDYGDLNQFKQWMDETCDHQFLNERLPYNTTVENMARHFYEVAKSMYPEVVTVRICEGLSAWAEYGA